MNYEKEPLHISTSVPNGTYEVTVTVTAHEDIVSQYFRSHAVLWHKI